MVANEANIRGLLSPSFGRFDFVVISYTDRVVTFALSARINFQIRVFIRSDDAGYQECDRYFQYCDKLIRQADKSFRLPDIRPMQH